MAVTTFTLYLNRWMLIIAGISWDTSNIMSYLTMCDLFDRHFAAAGFHGVTATGFAWLAFMFAQRIVNGFRFQAGDNSGT